jgi:acyl-CoA synthetase (AMP-forming)/AMP-acid ligase II
MIPEITVTQALFAGRRHTGPALVEAGSGRVLSYAELAEAFWPAAHGLAASGFGPGSVVAVHMPDVPEFAVALHAVLGAGATATTVRPTVTVDTMTRQLGETSARAVVTWPVLLDIALEAAKATEVERVFCFGSEPDAEPFSALSGRAASRRRPRLDPRMSLALLPYTKGAATLPRGVRLTHRNLLAALLAFAGTGLIGPADSVLSGLPLADVVALSTVLHPALRIGAAVVTWPGSGRRDLLRTLQDHQVTVAVLTPEQVETLAFDGSVGGYHLRSLRSIICTGGPLAPDTARTCSLRLRCPVRQAYGLAEAAGITHVNLRAADEGTLDSAGAALPSVRWRIVDPVSGTDQPSYQPGELRLRGPMVGSALRAADSPEWLPTQDAAFCDEDGRLYLTGRLEDGKPGRPVDAGTILAAHPAVADAAVVPVRDGRPGVHAFAVLAGGDATTASTLLAHLNRHLPAHRRVDSVHLVDAIPRSPGGRVLRRALIEQSHLPFLEG